ncbi:hypothetical protein C8R43DRAFT_1137002 [Mycena crocata]|nr:hypothetical protein C8R43DRAFT_1137002 [Mycena crocata]
MPLVIRSAGGGTTVTQTALAASVEPAQPQQRVIMVRRSTGGWSTRRAAAAAAAAAAQDDGAPAVPAQAPVSAVVAAQQAAPVVPPNDAPMANDAPAAAGAAADEPRPQINHSVWRSGARVTTDPPWEARVWLSEERPCEVVSVDEDHECSICSGVKTFPVTVWCGHSYCYECARRYLERSWKCPECRGIAYGPPIRQYAEERALRKAYPDHLGRSSVSYSWAGLQFPSPPNAVRMPVFH